MDEKIVVDIDLDRGIKRILDIQHLSLKKIDSHHLAAGVYDPILTDSRMQRFDPSG